MNAMLGTGTTGPSQAAQETLNRNQKVFKRYAISFAHMNEPQKFMEDATKFTKWLENPKGYYDAARPKVRIPRSGSHYLNLRMVHRF